MAGRSRPRDGLDNLALAACIVLAVAFFCYQRLPEREVISFQPCSPRPPIGVLDKNDWLRERAVRHEIGDFVGLETLARDESDVDIVYGGTAHGEIVRHTLSSGATELIANTGGRPLGVVLRGRTLYIADALLGLVSVGVDDGLIRILAHGAPGRPILYGDDLDIASDGTIYFSDASTIAPPRLSATRWGTMEAALLDISSSVPTGRLLKYDPHTKEVSVLMDEISFANGVALSADGSFVLVCETGRYRVLRYWLSGERKGERETFVDHLPGFPDGISRGSDGRFWVGLIGPRNPIMDFFHQFPILKRIVLILPPSWLKPTATKGHTIRLDGDGHIDLSLADKHGTLVHGVSSAVEVDGTVFLGNLEFNHFATYQLSEQDVASQWTEDFYMDKEDLNRKRMHRTVDVLARHLLAVGGGERGSHDLPDGNQFQSDVHQLFEDGSLSFKVAASDAFSARVVELGADLIHIDNLPASLIAKDVWGKGTYFKYTPPRRGEKDEKDDGGDGDDDDNDNDEEDNASCVVIMRKGTPYLEIVKLDSA